MVRDDYKKCMCVEFNLQNETYCQAIEPKEDPAPTPDKEPTPDEDDDLTPDEEEDLTPDEEED